MIIICIMRNESAQSLPAKPRLTRQRMMILETLRSLSTHPTAEELHVLVRGKLPSLSLATVYRNLERLSAEGLVNRIPGEGASRRFDGDVSLHHHARCRRCGQLVDLPARLPLPDLEGFPELGSFRVQGFRLEIVGECARCQAAGPAPASGGRNE